VDDLEPLLRARVSAASGDSEWFEENVLADIRAALVLVAKLAGKPLSDSYESVVKPRMP
jgi:hypothetical protein